MSKYLKIFSLSVMHSLKNYKTLVGLSIFLVTCLIIYAHLWKLIAERTGVFGLNPDQLLWYIAFNEWVLISFPEIQEEMEKDLRSGRLAYLLPRPISYLCATFFEGLGILCVNLIVLGLIAFSFTWVMVGHLPFSPSAFLVSLVLGVLAGCLALIIQMIVGLSAFWVQQVDPFNWIWEKSLFALGGLMLPLAVYPEWMQTIAYYTPFPAILGGRSALAIDYNLNDVLYVASSLLFWGMAGLIGLVLLYRKGLYIVNIEGG